VRTTPEGSPLGDDELARLEGAATEVAPAAGTSGAATHRASGDAGGPAEGLEVGASVGRYRVLERVGAGGMGVVYAAFDPELERKVALKFLRHDLGGGEAQQQFEARLRREAQAMAKLAHPNVAAVHDVGHYGGRVFVAMEFIEGPTLGRWLAQGPRPMRQVLETFAAAGRGLAAAHAAGLVHRDVKPENVLVGDDGRVRVVDFGLVRADAGAETAAGGDEPTGAGEPMGGGESAGGPALSPALGLTVAGAIMGTPAYMAPEQHRGREADAKSDQFSFCVALYEALYGERPFAGRTLDELRAAVLAGRVRPAPRGARVPGWLRRVLGRGLSVAPEGRFASMAALLAALGHDPGRRARRVAAGAAVVGLLAGGALWARPRVEPPCRGSERHLVGVWDGARRRAVEAALRATGAPFAEAAAREVGRAFDAYAAGWAAQHAEACEATRVRGEQTEELMGLRMACLDDRRHELRALGDRLIEADRDVAERAVQAAHRLSGLEACADARALEAPVRPPADAATRAEVEALRTRLAEARALEHAGRYKEGLGAARALNERAGALGYRPLEAEASFLLGELSDRTGDYEAAGRALDHATWAAEAGRHDEALVRALSALVRVRGTHQARYDQVEHLAQRGAAVLERLGKPGELEGGLRLELGRVHTEQGHYAQAEGELDRTLAALEQRYGPDDLRLTEALTARGVLAQRQVAVPQARSFFERALAIDRRALGDDHPEVATALGLLANVHVMNNEYAQGEAAYRQALVGLERAFGPEHPKVASVLHNLGIVSEWQGRFAEAEAFHRRAAALSEATLGADHPNAALYLMGLGNVFETQGKYAEALAIFERALPRLQARYGREHALIADALHKIGLVKMKLGKVAEARELTQQSHAMYKRALGDDHAMEGLVLQTLAEIELRSRRPERAIEPLEDALRVHQRHNDDPGVRASTNALLARALYDSGRDRARARGLAREAHDHMLRDERMARERAEFEHWLRTRRPALL
jgi:tetratricopeptide (TPR) repeat protein/predicted Ser/Thr protein kinase